MHFDILNHFSILSRVAFKKNSTIHFYKNHSFFIFNLRSLVTGKYRKNGNFFAFKRKISIKNSEMNEILIY